MSTILRAIEEKDQIQLKKLFTQLTDSTINLDIEELIADKACNNIIIEENGTIIGFATLVIYSLPTTGKVGKIEDVIVDEKFRGQGYGRKLIEELLNIAKKNNLKKIQLTSSPRREIARELYKKFGFKEKDTTVFVLNL
jgi:ribosomal protein S18 acetylase RimI-like enzyme